MTTATPRVGITELLAKKLTGSVALLCLRVSAQSPAELADNIRAAITTLRHLPAVEVLRQIDPQTLLDKSADGDRIRSQMGLIPLRRHHAHRHAVEPNRLMGYALPVPEQDAVILMLFDSAADPTVRTPDEQLPGNAVCALLSEACLIPQVHELHVAEWSRWVRDPRYGATVRAAAQRGGVDVYEGSTHIDITSSSGALLAGVKDTQAAGERNNIRIRTTRGTLAKLTAARVIWPYARTLLPPAYELELDRVNDGTGRSRRTAYVRSASGDQIQGWQKWAETIANGGTFAAAGQHLAAHKMGLAP